MALCVMHHKMLDRGAFTLEPDATVVVSEAVMGGAAVDEWIKRYHGRKLADPQREEYRPGEKFVAWHRREVFQEPEMVV